MIKLLVFLKRKPGMSSEDFHKYWTTKHAEIVTGQAGFMKYLRRYVQSHNIDDALLDFPGGGHTGFDGMVEVWFDDVKSMKAAFETPDYINTIRPDEPNFLDMDGFRVMVVEEHPKYTPPGTAATA
jgi:uncharacterized protein (TIGR02118 family)